MARLPDQTFISKINIEKYPAFHRRIAADEAEYHAKVNASLALLQTAVSGGGRRSKSKARTKSKTRR